MLHSENPKWKGFTQERRAGRGVRLQAGALKGFLPSPSQDGHGGFSDSQDDEINHAFPMAETSQPEPKAGFKVSESG